VHAQFHRCSVRGARLCIAAALLMPAGCTSLFGGADDVEHVRGTDHLQTIDVVDFAAQSTQPPVTVDDAASDLDTLPIDTSRDGEPLTLSLADVRAAALKHNLDLRVQLIAPSIAETSLDEERARFESTFFANVRRAEIDSPTPTPLIAGSQTNVTSFTAGVNIPLRTGGNITVDFPFNETDTNNPSAFLNPAYSGTARFSISQPCSATPGKTPIRTPSAWLSTRRRSPPR
jgi:hypothetical protein